uniref:Large ribosomal subunit protein uL29m n=1 Tax=Parascaris univalens TaxID=6257 RepID=A0A915AVE0_PARUN
RLGSRFHCSSLLFTYCSSLHQRRSLLFAAMFANVERPLMLISHWCSRAISTTLARQATATALRDFFDDEANFGKSELRPKKRPGRSWTADELRLKSNSDLHKLWYVLLKERNMLLTMEQAYSRRARYMPNPERLDRVAESMRNVEAVIHERNDAFFRLETGDGADPPLRTVTSFAGFTYKKPATEHYLPAEVTGTKEYEVPYLDDDAYMMQKLWNEKEHGKRKDSLDDQKRRSLLTEDKIRFKRSGPRLINKIEQL